MIDIENEIYSSIALLLRTQYGNTFNVSSERLNAPSHFPCVSIVQENVESDSKTQDSNSNENCVNVMFEINVYSNKSKTKKLQAKEIFALVNDKMIDLGFTRQMSSPMPNVDNSIYRILGRYIAKVDRTNKIYRR